jgi:hypothetical protein
MADEHPADEMFKPIKDAIVGVFNGDDIKKSIRDAWDRMHSSVPAPTEAPKSNAPALTDAIAAKIRDAAKLRMGK